MLSPKRFSAPLLALFVLMVVPALGQTLNSGEVGSTESPDVTNQPNQVQLTILGGPQDVFDGEAVTFHAVTDPPGFEPFVQWTASSLNGGSAEPATGIGAQFTTVFVGTVLACRRLEVVALLEDEIGETVTAVWSLIDEEDCYPDLFIPKGDDCWETEDCETIASFCTNPLPADFFAPGSHMWRDEIRLKGSDAVTVDTVIQRLNDVFIPELGNGVTPVRLSTLDLESCDPITVVFDTHEESWDVRVEQSDFPPSESGSMTISRTSAGGGTFASEFPVHVKYTFTGPDGTEVVLDTGDPDDEFDLDPILLKTDTLAPWVSSLQSHVVIPRCGVNFHPGVHGGGGSGRQCCKDVGHKGPGHLHKTGQKCETCPDGACYDKKKLKCKRVLPAQCTGADEVFMGAGTDCLDTDNDGLQNFAENDDCCKAGLVPQDACNALSDPGNADTDGDGMNDGAEILAGRDPCTPDP